MNLSYFLARKYYFSKNRKSFVNIISVIAVIIISLMVIAELVVLSVFNGFSNQLRGIHRAFDSDLEISVKEGKVFGLDPQLYQQIKHTEGVKAITRVLEDDAIFDFKEKQEVIRFKGVEPNFFVQNEIDSHIFYGNTNIFEEFPSAIVGYGVAAKFDLHLGESNFARMMYPNRKKSHLTKSKSSYKDILIQPKGIFEIEMEYDKKYVILPLKHAQLLTGHTDQMSALEIALTDEQNSRKVHQTISGLLPNHLQIKNRDQRHESIYKAIQVEKLLTYLIFVLILLIASLNLYAAISLLIVSKRTDIQTLNTLGATKQSIRQIFLYEGLLIIFTGIIIGSILACGFIWMQSHIGLIKMSAQSSIIDYIPVKLLGSDLLICIGLTILVSLAMIIRPIHSGTKDLV